MPEQPACDLTVHGTCVAVPGPTSQMRGALLRGAPGSGKSDLALRFVSRFGGGADENQRAWLVSDDQVCLSRKGDTLWAWPPAAIAGRLEVRGLGIVDIGHLARTEIVLLVDLAGASDVPRMPPGPLPREDVLGVLVPVLKLNPFESSCPEKLKFAMTGTL